MTALEEIIKLYYGATARTIEKDMARAIALLKTLPNEETRERAAVYMDGLSQMRSEWATASRNAAAKTPKPGGKSRSRA